MSRSTARMSGSILARVYVLTPSRGFASCLWRALDTYPDANANKGSASSQLGRRSSPKHGSIGVLGIDLTGFERQRMKMGRWGG
ncbi:hypothetical protein H2248_010735 [Termitomyces sp. 'cryptogamus']|nr:hypothetical protein H2248_010735 [Termitomyces sp. 'cryptogamus']